LEREANVSERQTRHWVALADEPVNTLAAGADHLEEPTQPSRLAYTLAEDKGASLAMLKARFALSKARRDGSGI
jgi:hypothetical protein